MASKSERFARAVLGLLGTALLYDEKGQQMAYAQLHEIDGSEDGPFGLACAMAAVAAAGLCSGDVVSCRRADGEGDGRDAQEILAAAGVLIEAVANGDEDGARRLWGSLDAVRAANLRRCVRHSRDGAQDSGPPHIRAVEPSGPYLALYRRYRPQRFADLAGQGATATALRNAVAAGRVAHAYLFSGPRGTGKTSTARILAAALNCEAPQGGEPCGACQSCLAVRSGSSLDVAELDAASHRRLEDMRELLAHVPLGTPGRRKVYIVDEVHQLTPDAAAALLKTLEEPPGHVCFVLATTEPGAVPKTLRSRCQHFQFGLIAPEALNGLVRQVAKAARLSLGDEALEAAVQEGSGSARDALSALERIAAGGGAVEAARAPQHVVALAEAVARQDKTGVLQAVAGAVAAGWEPRRVGQELLARLHQAFLALQAPSLAEATGGAASLGRSMGLPLVVRTMEAVGKAIAGASQVSARTSLEVALLACAEPANPATPAGLAERLARLEAALAQPSSPPEDAGPGAHGGTAGPLAEEGPLQGLSDQAGPWPPVAPHSVHERALAPLLTVLSQIAAGQERLAERLARLEALLDQGRQPLAAPGSPPMPSPPVPVSPASMPGAELDGEATVLAGPAVEITALKALLNGHTTPASAPPAAQAGEAREGPEEQLGQPAPAPGPGTDATHLDVQATGPSSNSAAGEAAVAYSEDQGVELVLQFFPGAEEGPGPRACPQCGTPVVPAPGSEEQGHATMCPACFEQARAPRR